MSQLKSLFEIKSWNIEKHDGMSLYDRYCNTLLKFEPDEQQFILELSRRFIRIDINEYLPIFEELAYRIRCEYPDSDIILSPCLPKKDIGNVKSAGLALYQMASTPYKYDMGNCWIEKNDIANRAAFVNDDSIIVLVDDFVGTGETAIGAVDYVHDVLGKDFPNDRIKVLSIVVQQSGKQVIESIGVQVYALYEFKKGISDYYEGDRLAKAIEVMEKIEKKINVKNQYRFGYGQSEALVCMMRCPNNTFPVYWLGKNTAPYERR